MQIQTSRRKETQGDVQPNASSQPENAPTSPKKNRSGLLSGYNATANNAQYPPAANSKPTSPSLIGLPPRPTQVPSKEVEKQNSFPTTDSSFREGNGPFSTHTAIPASQSSTQQPPKIFATHNVPPQPAQTRPTPNFNRYTDTSSPTEVSNNPSLPVAPTPVMPNTYPNTDNLALRNISRQTNPLPSPNYPAGITPYAGFSPMQPIPGMHPPYAQYGPPSSFKNNRKRRFPTWARIVTGFAAFILLIAGGLFTYYQVEIAPSLNNIIGQGAIHQSSNQNGTPVALVNTQNSSLSSQNRINILLLGSDTDGKNGAPLAQSDIVVTIDQQKHYVGMLSIPRDLQVSIPHSGAGKMDFAFSYGWQDQKGTDTTAKAEAGAGLAEDTIQANFGIHIDRYAWVGLTGFVKVIDTAGGVDVDVTHPMVDDNYPDDVANSGGSVYDYKRLYIAPGPQHLKGPQALEYVRTRHSDLIGDFGRSARQQQVLSALKIKLATPDTISQTPQLLKDLNGYLLTDMQLDDLAFLGNLARNVDLNKVQHLTLSPPYSTPSNVNTNYLPICSQITPAISQMFGIQANCIPQGSGAAGLASIIQPLPLSNSIVTKQGATQNSQQIPSQIPGPNLSRMDIVGGVHTLLDIMLMTVFESFNAIQV
jgi:LCP family protein required for cell wall assembly